MTAPYDDTGRYSTWAEREPFDDQDDPRGVYAVTEGRSADARYALAEVVAALEWYANEPEEAIIATAEAYADAWAELERGGMA